MTGTFTEQTAAQLIGHVRNGVAFNEACEIVGVSENTAKGWLTRGRQNPDTPHGKFAEAIDQAREQAAGEVMTEPEFERHLATAIRRGSVAAMKLWRTTHEPEHAPDMIDQLQARRANRLNGVKTHGLDELDGFGND